MSQTSYTEQGPSDVHRRADIERLEVVVKGFVLSDHMYNGAMVSVDRYRAPNGQSFDLVRGADLYRHTPVPQTPHEILNFGPWKPLAG